MPTETLVCKQCQTELPTFSGPVEIAHPDQPGTDVLVTQCGSAPSVLFPSSPDPEKRLTFMSRREYSHLENVQCCNKLNLY